MKKKFGLIGKSLKHSISPQIHHHWYDVNKIDANYELIEISENEIQSVIERIKKKDLMGINVTIPYKQTVIPFLDQIINEAKETQSVNTIYLNDEGKVIGENTDVYGFEYSFIKKIKSIDQKEALILGAGGVTPSIICALKKANIKRIYLSNRTKSKALDLKKSFNSIEIIDWETIEEKVKEIDILINATSLGTKGGEDFSQKFETIKKGLIYYDVVYNPAETKLMKHFSKQGAKVFNGLDMLIFQAQKAFLLWNNINPNTEDLKNKLKI